MIAADEPMTLQYAISLYRSRILRVGADPRLLAKSALWLLSGVAAHTGFGPFIILARTRTGSNLLVSYLNCHFGVAAQGELCLYRAGRSIDSCLRPAFGPRPRCVQVSGFRVFYEHPLDDASGELWERLRTVPSLRVIHLTRTNILRTLLSRKIAGEDGVWMDMRGFREQAPAGARVSFTTAELAHGFETTRRWEEQWPKMFADLPVLHLTYEDLVSRPRTTMRRVFGFLGLSYVRPRTQLRKQNRRALREVITNYGELKQAFARTKWTGFFDE